MQELYSLRELGHSFLCLMLALFPCSVVVEVSFLRIFSEKQAEGDVSTHETRIQLVLLVLILFRKRAFGVDVVRKNILSAGAN